MKENGIFIRIKDTGVVTKSGAMALSMKVTGKLTKLTVEEDLFMLMVIFMMVIGKTIKLMDLENTLTLMELSTKENGLTTSSTVKVKKSGQMVHSTKETTNLARKMDLENFCGLTGLLMKETSSTIIFMDTENTNGLTVVNSQVTGSAIRCTVPDSLHGLMVGATKVNIMMIKSKDMVSLRGLTAGNMMAHG